VTGRSIALFVAAALAEIGGAYLVWIGLREHKPAWVVVLGGLVLATPSSTSSSNSSTE